MRTDDPILPVRPKRKAPAKAGAEKPCQSAKIRDQTLLLCRLHFRILPAEALHAASGIHKLLLAGEERMACRADFHVDISLMGRACRKAAAAGAHNANFVVSGMNSCLHGVSKLVRDIRF